MTALDRRTLDVYLDGERVGHLERLAPQRVKFTYDPTIAERAPDRILLSASLPTRAEPYPNAEAKPFFEGLLPESPLRESVARAFGVRPANGFDLLEQIGAECAGAVAVVAPGTEPPQPTAAPSVRWLTERELATLIDELPTHPLGLGPDVRLSLGGAQQKLVVTRAPSGRIGQPLGGSPSTHIIKPAQREYADIVANEAFCLRLAAYCGLTTARSEVHDIAGRQCLVVERFDRTYGPDLTIRRLHQEDMCQALGVLPAQKYETEGGPRAADVVEALRSVSVRAAADVIAFLRAIAVDFLLGNSDAHAKNFALLYEPIGSGRLAPLYDIVSTAPYRVDQSLAMSIGRLTDPREVDEAAWRALAEECGVAGRLLVREVLSLAERAERCIDAVSEAARAEGWYRPVIDEIRSVVRARAAQLRPVAERPRGVPGPTTRSDELDPQLLAGRLSPSYYAPPAPSTEKALIVRVGMLARLPAELRLDTREQELFTAAVGASAIEEWFRGAAEPAATGAAPWRATEPTRSIVVTVRRPPVPMVPPAWTAEGRASISVRPFGSFEAGRATALLVVDVVIRPVEETDEASRPLSPQGFFALLYATVTAVVDDVAPLTLDPIVAPDRYDVLAFDALVVANSLPLSRFVPLDWHTGTRAEGMYDASFGEWPLRSLRNVADPELRAETVRGWVGELYRESGFSGYEPALEALTTPTAGRSGP
jgi:serine/threonine-protein kinase HipA